MQLTLSQIVHVPGEVRGGTLPFNPLEALDWDNINLRSQISDDFVDNCQVCQTLEDNFSPAIVIDGVEFRRYDAVGNNINDINLGRSQSAVPRCIPPAYSDGFNSLAGDTRMNVREISNVISKQIPEDGEQFINNRHLTQFAWQWGQFIDHDITLLAEDKDVLDFDQEIDIYVPCNDPVFDTDGECDANQHIEVFRTQEFSSGTDETNIRQQFNSITAYIDGSMIYGSDKTRADFLRTFQDGMLKEEGGNLPKNTGNFSNDPMNTDDFFLGGDVRTNEHLGLLTMHIIWVRAHNIIAELVGNAVDIVSIVDDTARDEAIFQYTRTIISSIIQKIVYDDWLPILFGKTAIAEYLGEYVGYDDTEDAGICPIFSTAAFRFGHTMLPQSMPLRDENCAEWDTFDINNCPLCGGGFVPLRSVFFTPDLVENNMDDGIIEATLHGMACTLANEVDTATTDAVRNFLFESSINPSTGERLNGHMDLIAINLQRGREHGLPDYNTVRRSLGLPEFELFDEITSDPDLAENLREIYDDDIDDVDLFLGLLAEDHFEDGSFGATASAITLEQFARIRDGDRFFYKNLIKPGELRDFIECVSLKSIIEMTTDIDNIDSIDSLRNNMFQNERAISIFAGTDTFEAQAVGNNMPIDDNNDNDINWNPNRFNNHHSQEPQQEKYNNNYYSPQQEPKTYVIELNNFQIFLILISIILIIGCSCYTLSHYKKNNKNHKYNRVKFDTETGTDTDRDDYIDSDREKLQK